MVPVLDSNNIPIMPCSEKRARQLMEKKQAIPHYKKGIFCIKLTREPSSRNFQPIALGIDPGSKREGYTVATTKHVVLNITSNTPDWVKERVETRRARRGNRRYRKTPYRQMRTNRSSLRKTNRIPPSTKARWGAKLRIVKCLQKILPITTVNVEDIKAATKEGKRKWNVSFSPLEAGKKWFYSEIELLDLQLKKTDGFDTFAHRNERQFKKSKAKLSYTWEAHNVDSHCLAEMALDIKVKPYRKLFQLEFLQFHRRQLHVQRPIKNGIRKQYGGTVSLGLPRGGVTRYKGNLVYIGGTSKRKLSIHDIKNGARVSQKINPNNVGKILFLYRWIIS